MESHLENDERNLQNLVFNRRLKTEEKLSTLHLLMKELNKTEWGKLISNVLFEKNKIKKPLDVKVSTTSDGEWFSFDITCHSDRTLLKLAEQCNFPRGFTAVISSDGTKSGMATFYPKFDNDSRNREGESINDGCDRIVVTNKASGSTLKFLFIDDNWCVSSKNSSLNNEGSYSDKFSQIMSSFITIDVIDILKMNNITSIGAEAFLMDDQVHGYGYNKDGFVVTCMTRLGENGSPEYVTHEDMISICDSINFPVDTLTPQGINGEDKISKIMNVLIQERNLLTLDETYKIFNEARLATCEFVTGEIIEGFVIRRFKNGKELKSIKFKCWFYQMITQVLRPLMNGKNKLNNGPMRSLRNQDGTFITDFLVKVEEEISKDEEVEELEERLANVAEVVVDDHLFHLSHHHVLVERVGFAIQNVGEDDIKGWNHGVAITTEAFVNGCLEIKIIAELIGLSK